MKEIAILLVCLAILTDVLWVKKGIIGAVIIAFTGAIIAVLFNSLIYELGIMILSIPTVFIALFGGIMLLLIRKGLYSMRLF